MPWYRRKDSPYFYGWVYGPDGRPTQAKSLKVRDERAAEIACREWERRLADPAGSAKSVTLKEVLDGLGAYLLMRRNRGLTVQETVNYHRQKCDALLWGFGQDFPVADLDSSALEAYARERSGHSVTEHTITKELRTLKFALRVAKLKKTFFGDLEAIFPRLHTGYKPRDRFLSDDELAAVIGLASPDVGAMIAFSVATSAELRCLNTAKREDVPEDGRYVLLRGTKRETRYRTVPIVTERQTWLLAYAMVNAQGTDRLFATSQWGLITMLRKITKRLGLAHVSPNDLRRTFAVNMREAGFPIELIAPLMGHKDTQMLQRVYGRLTPEQLRERLVAALNAHAVCSKAGRKEKDSGVRRRTEEPLTA